MSNLGHMRESIRERKKLGSERIFLDEWIPRAQPRQKARSPKISSSADIQSGKSWQGPSKIAQAVV
ncbi:hypothetical protein GBA52_014588 [Prunus armeniaca]|nr:hypothetical protein GBA52_014588 [Prunus armeniaca]